MWTQLRIPVLQLSDGVLQFSEGALQLFEGALLIFALHTLRHEENYDNQTS